ncbi:G-type lectin S-receptor-like serine/threonine-protein kinase At4g27290 [Rutidosis leptorrhynchoides]|uniref:G-type lectin S-receptor-like serine/threonine-protein kinase At4g27290 n=1 Tax=Rutidosis leptorrhynchoides TaxID=125765 RepID=UPI003A9A2C44
MEKLTILYLCFHALFTCIIATDTLTINQTLKDGDTIVSSQNYFELGFFSPTNTTQDRYLGIWYKQLANGPVIWVANRETPIGNKSGELTLNLGGLLVLRDSTTNRIIWSSNLTRNAPNVVAQLLDDSNFMVFDDQSGPENYIWQSFDYPTDTIMPDMKFGRNLKRGVVTNYTSWKSDDDPSKGQYMIYMDFNGLPQIFQKKGNDIQYRLGSWNGVAYSGNSNNQPNPIYRNWYSSDENEVSAVYELLNKSVLTRLTISPEGNMGQWYWVNRTQGWVMYTSLTTDSCERFELCGVYGSCDINLSPNCGCLRGFVPKRPDQWDIADWSSGCQREIALDCGVGEGFRKYSFMKLPDTRESWFDRSMSVEQCRVKCKNECNCTAYATLDIRLGTGCLIWYNELNDMRVLPDNGQDIFIRMSAIELEKDKIGSRSKKKVWAIAIPVALGSVITIGLCIMILIKKKKAKGRHIVEKDGLYLPMFNLSTLSVATNNFSVGNKLGEGGFGPVYKGVLEDGQEVAVKRLSIGSNQGDEEFKNEVIFISKLQHRNLVKILGYCIEGVEKLLVYEYMPNSSLDFLLFDDTKSKRLDWPQRFQIINGIARGLLYLHQDSQLLIIHRDLKAANILLDCDMNPKISDFGLARSFGGTDTATNTNKVVGTYGYMSPEYAGDGIFSIKSDVFSFGVLILEIVSGKKNRGFYDEATFQNLLGHAWTLYKEKKTLDLADSSLVNSNCIHELLRCIHVALLCVQHNANDRPNMSAVVTMLSGEGQLPDPEQPGFYAEKDGKFGPETSYGIQTKSSNNDTTFIDVESR